MEGFSFLFFSFREYGGLEPVLRSGMREREREGYIYILILKERMDGWMDR